jgi:hypothetical protein
LSGRRRLASPRRREEGAEKSVVGRRHAPIVRRALRRATDRRWHVPPLRPSALRGRPQHSPWRERKGTWRASSRPKQRVPKGKHVRSARPPAAFVSVRYAAGLIARVRCARSRSHGGRTATAINPSAEASCLSCPSLSGLASLRCVLSGGRRDSPPSQPRRVVSAWPIIAKQPSLRDPHWPVTFPEPDRRQISPASQRWQGFVYGISLHVVPTIGRSVGRGPKKVFINLPSTRLSDAGVGSG